MKLGTQHFQLYSKYQINNNNPDRENAVPDTLSHLPISENPNEPGKGEPFLALSYLQATPGNRQKIRLIGRPETYVCQRLKITIQKG